MIKTRKTPKNPFTKQGLWHNPCVVLSLLWFWKYFMPVCGCNRQCGAMFFHGNMVWKKPKRLPNSKGGVFVIVIRQRTIERKGGTHGPNAWWTNKTTHRGSWAASSGRPGPKSGISLRLSDCPRPSVTNAGGSDNHPARRSSISE